MLSNDALS